MLWTILEGIAAIGVIIAVATGADPDVLIGLMVLMCYFAIKGGEDNG